VNEFKKFILGLLVTLMIFSGFPTSTSILAQVAERELDEEITLFVDNDMNEQEEEAIIYEFMNTPDATLVFLFDEYSIEDVINSDANGKDMEEAPLLNRGVGVGWQFRVTRGAVGNSMADTTRTIGSAVNGQPGMNLSLSRTNSFSNSVTSTFGATNNMVTSSVGFSVTASNSFTQSTSMVVPRTSGGRNVRSMTLRAHPYIRRTTFRTYRRHDSAASSAPWEFRGTGTATRQLGIAFRHTINF